MASIIPTTSVFLTRTRPAKKSPSSTIPIPNSQLARSHSDIQLENDKKMYEWRDGIMFHRLLNGMLQRHQEVGYHPKINRSVQNVMQTQASPVSAAAASSDIKDDGFTSGSSSSSSSSEEWFFYESSCDEQVDSRYPFLAHSQPRPRESLDPKWCSNSQGVTQSCPELPGMKVEQNDSNGDDGIMLLFDLDL